MYENFSEAEMSKRKSIIFLSIISLLMAFLLVMTFIRFPVGTNKQYSFFKGIGQGYDFGGGTAYEVELLDSSDRIEDIDEVLETLKYRLDALGYTNSSVKAIKSNDPAVKDYRVRIEARGANNEYGKQNVDILTSDIQTVLAYGELKFYGGTEEDPSEEIFVGIENPVSKVEYNGAQTDGADAYYPVTITFSKQAYDELITNIRSGDYYLKVMIGDTELPLFGEVLLESYFAGRAISVYPTTETFAKQIVLQIESGGLPCEFNVQDMKKYQIESAFGNDIPLIACIIVGAFLLLSIAVLCVKFKGFGIAASLSLIDFMLIEMWMLVAIPGIKVSIASVLGILVATIIAIDGAILTGKRIQEEFARGKTVKASVNAGFKRALVPIISGCLIAGVVALCLFALTTAQVQAFAITLGIGAVAAAICGLLFTRMFTVLLLPLAKNKETFLNLKREDN